MNNNANLYVILKWWKCSLEKTSNNNLDNSGPSWWGVFVGALTVKAECD